MKHRFVNMLKTIWRSTSALVAVILIIAAFIAGVSLRLGRSTDRLAPPTTQGARVGGRDSGPAALTAYTCAMHPAIRQPEPGRCPICGMELIPAGADDDEHADRTLVMTPAAMKLAEIRTTPVVREYPTLTVRLFGNVDYDETRIATIAAYFPGRLERLFVDYTGVPVKEGEHLAAIYSPELISTQEELQQALAAVGSYRDADETVRFMNEARLQAAREKLRLWGLPPAQIRELEQSEQPLERLTIYSPVSGVVIEKTAVEGMYVDTGDEIYKVADLSRLWVRLEAYESQLPWLRYGQDVQFTTESLPGEVFRGGQISFIDPVISRDTRTVQVRVIADNAKGRLKPGMFVRATVRPHIAGNGVVVSDSLAGKWICPMHPEIVKDEPERCDICDMPLGSAEELGYVAVTADVGPPLVIPATAPLITGRRAVVYVRVPDREMPTFEGREVVLGPRAGDAYLVQEGLQEGEEVVVKGAFKIDSALQIAAKPSMMAPDQEVTGTVVLPPRFIADLGQIYLSYFAAQEALASDDLDAYRQAARELAAAVGGVGTTGLTTQSAAQWQGIARRLRSEAGDLDSVSDLKTARFDFDDYSKTVIDLQRQFGHSGPQHHYVIFCPMAFDNRGTTWLSRTSEVRNPYFGASMLRCGKVRSTFVPRPDDAR